MPAAKDVAEYMEDQSIGTVGTTIFVGYMPDDPDDCISVTQYAGRPPFSKERYERPGVQVRVRAVNQENAETTVFGIFNLLHDKEHVTMESRMYEHVEATASPSALGPDAKGRYVWVVNFIVLKAIET